MRGHSRYTAGCERLVGPSPPSRTIPAEDEIRGLYAERPRKRNLSDGHNPVGDNGVTKMHVVERGAMERRATRKNQSGCRQR